MNNRKVSVDITVSDDNLVSLLSCAFTGGISYWCSDAEVNREKYVAAKNALIAGGKKSGEICVEDIYLKVLDDGGAIVLPDAEDSDETYELTLSKILKGIQLTEAARMTGEIDAAGIPSLFDEGGDSNTADCIIQYALFGEIIFG